MTRKEQLKADLLKNFSDFQKIDPNVAPGGSDAANSIVAEGLADSIDRAIDDGVEFSFQGVFAVKDINAIQEKAPGYLYTCSDSGILKAKTELPVVKNTVVLWNGEDFKTFLVIPAAPGSSVQISVDSFLSTLSGNPVQNKVVTTAINALSEALASEAASRASADTALGGRIDAEATARENADATLQGNIDAEETAREDADATLQSNIESEATEREQADGELQAQIDAISSRSDVVDVVASYAELVAYDTSTLADNDVIKVLADETHEDAIAYYRWSTTTEAWSFVGSQGPYYTISEADALLAGKAPTNHASTATTYGVGDATKYGHVKVDSALSASSTNPVQNKAVKSAVDGLQSTLDNCVKPCAVISDSGGDYTVWIIKTKVLFLADANVSTPLFIRLVGGSYDSKNIDIQISSYRNPYNNTSGDFLGFTNLSGSFVPQIYEDYYTGDDGKLYKRFYIVSPKHSYRVYVYAWFQSSRHIGSSSLDGWTVEYSNTAPVVGENFCVSVTEYSSISARQLLHSRNLKVDLASESAQSFNGSANAESIGVSGTLPITHGGTGATTAAGARTNLGLGNVENESVSNGTPDFTEATTRTNILTGEKMSVLFGKIKKWFADLKTVAFTGSYNDLVDKPTIPAGQVQSDWNETGTSEPSFIKNKPQNLVQDASYVHTDNNYSTSEKNKLAGIETGAQVNNIFVAVYTGNHNDAGNTPYADIYAAYQAGKRIMCWNGNGNARRLYALNGFNSTDKIFKFTACGGDGESILEVSFAYMEGNINSTECRTNNYLLAKRNHASSDTTYGTGTSSNYGHVKLSALTNSTSGVNDGVAATPSAVKAAYDLANDKLDKTGDGKDVTVTFTEASTRTDVASGDTLATLFGKVKKWFSSLGSLAFKSSVADGDISEMISDAHIASASTWNGKAPRNHANGSNIYGQGTSDKFGHVMLSDSIQNLDSSQGYAATPKAVKAAYDLANGKYTKPSGGIPDNDIASASTWNGKYTKPSGGIPDNDIASASTWNNKANKDGSDATGIWPVSVSKDAAFLANNDGGNRTTNTAYWYKVAGVTKTLSSSNYASVSVEVSISDYGSNTSVGLFSFLLKDDGSDITSVVVSGMWNGTAISGVQFGWSRKNHNTADIYIKVPTYKYFQSALLGYSGSFITNVARDHYRTTSAPSYSCTLSSIGSSTRPVYLDSDGMLKQCDFIVNKGSHSTVTMDFSGTAGTDPNTIYFV